MSITDRINQASMINLNVLLGVGRSLLAHVTIVTFLSLVSISGSQAHASRGSAFVLDTTSGRVLYSRAGDERRCPASLAKIMTLYLLFEDLEKRLVSTTARFKVSKHAAAQQPSKLRLKPQQHITAEDAIRTIVTLSANDVAVVISENLSGTEPAFAARMTRTAQSLGMHHTRFRNASGLPDKRQCTTARDMALLGAALQARFPDKYRYFKTRTFTYRGHTYLNHNHLLKRIPGADGIKTGYIRASGFNVVVSLKRSGRKVVAVVMGGRTVKARDARAASLVKHVLPKARRGQSYYAGLLAAIRRTSPQAGVVQVAGPLPVPVPVPRPSISDSDEGILPRVAAEYIIQLGALPTKRAALGVIERAQPYVIKISKDAEPMAQRVDVNGKALFRARF